LLPLQVCAPAKAGVQSATSRGRLSEALGPGLRRGAQMGNDRLPTNPFSSPRTWSGVPL